MNAINSFQPVRVTALAPSTARPAQRPEVASEGHSQDQLTWSHAEFVAPAMTAPAPAPAPAPEAAVAPKEAPAAKQESVRFPLPEGITMGKDGRLLMDFGAGTGKVLHLKAFAGNPAADLLVGTPNLSFKSHDGTMFASMLPANCGAFFFSDHQKL